MKLYPNEDIEGLMDQLFNLTVLKRYTKIFAKVPEKFLDIFLDHQFKLEAVVPGLYNGGEQGCFMGKFFNARRTYVSKQEKERFEEIIKTAKQANEPPGTLPDRYKIIELDEEDAPILARIYKSVFQVYPFPVFKEKYLIQTMRNKVRYFGVLHEGELIAVSSADIDTEAANAEMTDFATLPKYHGRNLSYFLCERMIKTVQQENIKTIYTIARANSFGMNKTFGRHGFHFGGTLINNTLIGRSIESMNVWYK